MPNYEDRVKGMFLGIAIGDALGMPVETFTADQIKETYGRVTEYHAPDKHKWFDGEKAGMTTDDTQLTIAVAEALIESGLDIEAHAAKHVEAFHVSTKGWGRATKESIRNIANGQAWNKASLRKGVGNGIAMKVAPLGAYLYAIKAEDSVNALFDFVFELSLMTHGTPLAAASGLAQMVGTWMAFAGVDWVPEFREDMLDDIHAAATKVQDLPTYDPEDDDLVERIEVLQRSDFDNLTDEKIIEHFGGGTCYVYNSLPFTYAFFLRNPNSIEALYDVVSAGGDTDSNGSMVGAMLGARNGVEIFPDHLVEGVLEKDRILSIAQRFCEAFPSWQEQY